MKSLFQPEVYQDSLNRMKQLNAQSTPQWGKMTVGQMLTHVAKTLDISSGRQEEKKPSFIVRLMRPMIKKMVYGPKPFPKNSPTSPQFKIKQSVAFEDGLNQLNESLSHFVNPKHRDEIVSLPSKVFGPLTEDEKGFAMWKHLDHHFRQFGV